MYGRQPLKGEFYKPRKNLKSRIMFIFIRAKCTDTAQNVHNWIEVALALDLGLPVKKILRILNINLGKIQILKEKYYKDSPFQRIKKSILLE